MAELRAAERRPLRDRGEDGQHEERGVERIEAPAQLKFIAADLAREPLEGVLASAGFEAHAGAAFSWLGVTQYLSPNDVFATLRYVAGATAAAGGITFDYSIAPQLLDFTERWAYEALAARVSAVGEPWLSHFVPAELVTACAGASARGIQEALTVGVCVFFIAAVMYLLAARTLRRDLFVAPS